MLGVLEGGSFGARKGLVAHHPPLLEVDHRLVDTVDPFGAKHLPEPSTFQPRLPLLLPQRVGKGCVESLIDQALEPLGSGGLQGRTADVETETFGKRIREAAQAKLPKTARDSP